MLSLDTSSKQTIACKVFMIPSFFILMIVSMCFVSQHIAFNSVYDITNESASAPSDSNIGTIVTALIKHATSVIPHSSLFFENTPRKL
jgi:hypothetical protein